MGWGSWVLRDSAMLTLQMVCETLRSRLERPMSSFLLAGVYRIIGSLSYWQLQCGWEDVLHTNSRKEVCFA